MSTNGTFMKLHHDEYESVPPEEFLKIGMGLLQKPLEGSEKIQRRRFVANFGASWEICSILWQLCLTSGDVTFFKSLESLPSNFERLLNRPPYKPKHLLYAMHFMKCYSTENQSSSELDRADEKTFRKWTWVFIEALAGLKNEVVSNTRTIFFIKIIFILFSHHPSLSLLP